MLYFAEVEHIFAVLFSRVLFPISDAAAFSPGIVFASLTQRRDLIIASSCVDPLPLPKRRVAFEEELLTATVGHDSTRFCAKSGPGRVLQGVHSLVSEGQATRYRRVLS